MKSFLLITVCSLNLISCSPPSKKEELKEKSQPSKENIEINFPESKKKIKNLEGGLIKISLTEKDLSNSTLIPVSKKFYENYIKGNSHFEQNSSTVSDENPFPTNHFYWGKIKSTSDYKFILISQLIEMDSPIGELFLLIFDSQNKLVSTNSIAELSYPPGGMTKKYSNLQDLNQLETFLIQEDIIDEESNESGETKYFFEKDSITVKYALKKGMFIKNYRDSVTTKYWK